MPDHRQHRGRHPADAQAFGPQALPQLHAAVADLSWLLSRNYAVKSALKLVGDRYTLIERQRTAVMRCACSDASLARRREHRVEPSALHGETLLIDGYNVLTTVESALAGGVVMAARDGCYRDMASMHGTFHTVSETAPAIALLGRLLLDREVRAAVWYLDRPVSNSGRLKSQLLEIAAEYNWNWRVELVANPDSVLIVANDVVATADSVVLDRCNRWFNLARDTVERLISDTRPLDLETFPAPKGFP